MNGLIRYIPASVIMLLLVLLTGCRSHKPKEQVETLEVVKISSLHNPDESHRLLADEALSWLGTPYAYAKADKGIGTDCSGMVLKVYLDVIGAKLPRNSAQQADFCNTLEEEEVEIGDLVFFATGHDLTKVSHVGIMLSEKDFIHASASKGVVISDITTPYYTKRFIKFGRVPVSPTS